ncbi:hypothetical protein [Caballeronia sp. CLC5]|uniref:hypothetical protein n=1 Tax=Caballeronia sp. CLC5 TaxID=2906764 RepID=UPI001F2678BB|nr:hypothetical protein [Caballeronia sp. CLC5]MCE4573822.1 hypothetical protein [Caballeronia sp. CLC5]
MTVIARRSRAAARNKYLIPQAREKNEGNVGWINRALENLPLKSIQRHSFVLLIGGADPLSFRLRLAQAHVRSDLSPSSWSGASFISVQDKSANKDTEVVNVSLSPRTWYPPHGFAPICNAIQTDTLAHFDSPKRFPNLALLVWPVAGDAIQKSLAQLRRERIAIDLSSLMLRWMGYAWGCGVPSNPLGEGFGMPSAAMLETAFAANGFDLTPGLESRSSCPEAIWQSASWWHEYYSKDTRKPQHIYGAYTREHYLVDPSYFPSDAS